MKCIILILKLIHLVVQLENSNYLGILAGKDLINYILKEPW